MSEVFKVLIFLAVVAVSIFLLHRTWTNADYTKPLWVNILLTVAGLIFLLGFAIRLF